MIELISTRPIFKLGILVRQPMMFGKMDCTIFMFNLLLQSRLNNVNHRVPRVILVQKR